VNAIIEPLTEILHSGIILSGNVRSSEFYVKDFFISILVIEIFPYFFLSNF